MTEETFWELIDASGTHGADLALRNEATSKRLHELDEGERIQFGQIYHAHDSAAYRWDLWGAAYQINGGCSDDGFDYFRAWIISQGRAVYEAALDDPDSLADHLGPDDEDYENEDFLWLARETLGDTQISEFPGEPAGQEWDFDDEAEMKRRFPQLTRNMAPESSEPTIVREAVPGFSSLGFRIAPDIDSLSRLLESAAAVSRSYPASHGEVLLEAGDHYRLWQNFSVEDAMPVLECCPNPGMTASIETAMPDGLIKAWIANPENPELSEPIAVLFGAPHELFGTEIPRSQLLPLSLTLLAHQGLFYDSAEALAADPRVEGWPVPALAARGMMDEDGHPLADPKPKVFLTGTVLSAVKSNNHLCASQFWVLRVASQFGELWVCLPLELLNHDPTGQVVAADGRMSGSFPDFIPAPVEEEEKPALKFDNDAVEERIRELTLEFMGSDEFSTMFGEIHPGKLELGLVKGIGLFNKGVREIAANLSARRQLSSPELKARYTRMAETAPIVFAHIVMANSAAIEKGDPAPALVVLAWGDSGMEIMAKARDVLSKVHFNLLESEREKQLAALIDDEDYHFGRRRHLPSWLAGDQEAYAADLWVSQEALDNERLRMEVIVCFAERGGEGMTMAIPGRFIQQAIREHDPSRKPPPFPLSPGPPPLPPSSGPPPLPPQ